MYETFKRKVEALKEAPFKSGAVKHAAQFTKTLQETAKYIYAKYIYAKYNSDVARLIKMLRMWT